MLFFSSWLGLGFHVGEVITVRTGDNRYTPNYPSLKAIGNILSIAPHFPKIAYSVHSSSPCPSFAADASSDPAPDSGLSLTSSSPFVEESVSDCAVALAEDVVLVWGKSRRKSSVRKSKLYGEKKQRDSPLSLVELALAWAF